MADRVVVRAPATIANLGPGFDCLGIALAWYNEVRVERDPSGALTVTVAGAGAAEIPRDATNLAVRAISRVLGDVSGQRVHLTNAIPFGRGFGSSAAAIVGGLVAGRALGGDPERWDPAALVAAGAEMEGHADNVASCVYGGVTVVVPATVASGAGVLALGVPPGIEPLVCVAPTALETSAARRALPERVAFGDAVATAGRAALLAASLVTGDASRLMEATDDVLHQPARFELEPDAGRLVASLRREGIAAFLAGAGPSVAALVSTDQAAGAEAAARRLAPEGWEVRRTSIDPHGAAVVESDQALP